MAVTGNNVKAAILEKNGTEYDMPVEYEIQAEDIPFSDPSFSSGDVKQAIIEASTGGDPRPSDKVDINNTMTISLTKHHVVMNDMCIDGDLVIDGELGVI